MSVSLGVPVANVNENVDHEVEPTFVELLETAAELTSIELDERLARAARKNTQSEMELCAFLSEVRDRKAHREFGFTSVYDYARKRFQFGERKTRYLIATGAKIRELPKLRQAMKEGKIGWCKASRISPVITPQNEAMWIDSALSLTVRELESKIKDGTGSELTGLHFWLDAELNKNWEFALEIYRRRAGADISPAEAFEYMIAEVVATWGDDLEPHEPAADELEQRQQGPTPAPSMREPMPEEEADTEIAPSAPLFPHAEPIALTKAGQPPLFEPNVAKETELAIAFAKDPAYNAIRAFVLERDGWKCSYPGCSERRNLHVHHVRFRSRGGGHQPWNLTVVCEFHHGMLHREEVQVRGHAPFRLEWTLPRLMREALERDGDHGPPAHSATG